jgi:predicted amidohydrolase
MTFKVAACQYATALGDKEQNTRLSVDWLDRAGEAGADLVALPELVTTGYNLGDRFLQLAEAVPGPVTDLWAEKARQYGYYVVAGLCRRDRDMPSVLYNSAVLIGPTGDVEGVYDKVALPLYLHGWPGEKQGITWDEPEYFRAGDELPVFRTDLGIIGIQICQDAMYPEFARVQVLKGARLIVQLLNGIAMETEQEPDITATLTRVHAFDNIVYILLANKCGTETVQAKGKEITVPFRGESHLAGPHGNLLAKAAPQQEELLIAEIDLDSVRLARWRTKLYRDWRPDLLARLCE